MLQVRLALNLILASLLCFVGSDAHAIRKKPKWAGYSGVVNGNMGGVTIGTKGANAICHSTFSGSHACTRREIIALGNSYPYSSDAWVIDGAYTMSDVGTNTYQVAKDGNDRDFGNMPGAPNCAGWATASALYLGPILRTTGLISISGCNSAPAVPCCK